MCHIILLLPILGLVVFWLLPLSVAVPVYAAILLVSGSVYFMMMRAMRRPVRTGAQGMLHEIAEVVETMNPTGRVRVHGEIWEAVSSDVLREGDRVEIVGVTGLTLQVRKRYDLGLGEASHPTRENSILADFEAEEDLPENRSEHAQ